MWRSYLHRSSTLFSSATMLRTSLRHPIISPGTVWLSSGGGFNKEKKRVVARAAVGGVRGGHGVSAGEVKKLLGSANVEELKKKLEEGGKEVIEYSEMIRVCETMGVVKSVEDGVEFARALDEAGVVLLFRDKVYLHPHKIVDLVGKSVPLALTPEDDARREELRRLEEQKEVIDRHAHKQVRGMLWVGMGLVMAQIGLFFRLTFWDFSWDVMEPIAFFTTSTGVITGYTFFLFTSKDLSYIDLMQILSLSRQRKLFKKYNFDANRFKDLRDKTKCHLDKKRMDDSLAK